MLLFEYILREANKERFLKALWDEFADYSEEINYYSITYDELLDFVNSDDILLKEKFKDNSLNWQSKNSEAKWDAIIAAYLERLEKREENKKEKEAFNADTFKEVAELSGFNVAEPNDSLDDASFLHLSSLETENFDFYIPLVYEASVFCDSVKSGGQGAKWCIGNNTEPEWWYDHLSDGSIFILAINKNELKQHSAVPQDRLKFMIELAPYNGETDKFGNYSGTQAWIQSNDRKKSIMPKDFKKVFGRTAKELLYACRPIYLDNTDYSWHIDSSMYDLEQDTMVAPWSEDI